MRSKPNKWIVAVGLTMGVAMVGADAPTFGQAILIEGQGTVLRDNTVDTGGTAIEVGDSTTGAKLSGNTILNALLGIDRGGAGGNLIAGNAFTNVTTDWTTGGSFDGVLSPDGTWWQRVCVDNEAQTMRTCLYPERLEVGAYVYTLIDGNLTVPGTVTANKIVSPEYEMAPGVELGTVGRFALNSGVVLVDQTGKTINLKGIPPTRFFTQPGDTSTIWAETEFDFQAAFALYVDKACFPDEPDQCGPINRPCCTFTQALARMQEKNDNGFATCSVDQSTGCGRCSTSTDVQCNEDRDCPLNVCSTSSSTQCDKDGDCPAGETCGVVETCAASNTACSDLGLGSCTGNNKFYTIKGGGGSFIDRITPEMVSPGNVAFTGDGQSVTTITSRNAPAGMFTTPSSLAGPFAETDCVVSMYGATNVTFQNIAIQGSLAVQSGGHDGTNGLCLFGDAHNVRVERAAVTSSLHLPVYHGAASNGRWNGRDIATILYYDASIWGFFGQGNIRINPASSACSHDLSRACINDSNCDGRGTCTVGANGDTRLVFPVEVLQGGERGGTALDVASEACGTTFNLNLDFAMIQWSKRTLAGAPDSTGIRMRTVSCSGPFDPARNGLVQARTRLRINNVHIRGVDNPTYSEPDRSIVLEDYNQIHVRGPMSYDPCRRHIASTARIIYAASATATESRETGGYADLGSILCDEPNDPQDGECWTVEPEATGVSFPGRRRCRIEGVTRDTIYGTFDPVTGATTFAGKITDTITSDVGAQTGGTPAFKIEGNGVAGATWDYLLGEYIPLAASRFHEGYGHVPGNDTCLIQGRGCAWWDIQPNNQISLFKVVPVSSTWTPAPANTATETPTPTITSTPTPTSTAPTLTPTPTFTVTNTRTPTATYNTADPSWTPTVTRTTTHTPSPTFTPTNTRTPTSTGTATRAPEATIPLRRDGMVFGFLHWWVGDTSKAHLTPTPVIECRTDTNLCNYTGSTASDPNVANVAAVKTLLAAITPPPTPVPTPKAWFHMGAMAAGAAINTTVLYSYADQGLNGAVETNRQTEMTADGECDRMRAKINATLAGDEAIIVTLRKNAADTSLTCTIPNSGSSCSLSDTAVSFSAGDKLAWSYVCSGAGCPTAAVGLDISARCRFS